MDGVKTLERQGDTGTPGPRLPYSISCLDQTPAILNRKRLRLPYSSLPRRSPRAPCVQTAAVLVLPEGKRGRATVLLEIAVHLSRCERVDRHDREQVLRRERLLEHPPRQVLSR